MKRLLLAVAVLVVLPFIFDKSSKALDKTKVVIGKVGRFRTIEEFDIWLKKANRTSQSELLTVEIDSRHVSDMHTCIKWLNTIDLRGNNVQFSLLRVPPGYYAA